jgi:tetratricopeptide (TPR) repeat protein
MLQVGRALFRDGLVSEAREFFDIAARQAPESAEAVALVGFAQHRLGEDDAAIATLRRALQLDADNAEARIYLGNILYDRGELEAALFHLDRTSPEDHWEELGIWRLIELKKTIHRLIDDDADIRRWESRLTELAGEPDAIDDLLAEIEQRALEDSQVDARNQLELFAMLAPGRCPPDGSTTGS